MLEVADARGEPRYENVRSLGDGADQRPIASVSAIGAGSAGLDHEDATGCRAPAMMLQETSSRQGRAKDKAIPSGPPRYCDRESQRVTSALCCQMRRREALRREPVGDRNGRANR